MVSAQAGPGEIEVCAGAVQHSARERSVESCVPARPVLRAAMSAIKEHDRALHLPMDKSIIRDLRARLGL